MPIISENMPMRIILENIRMPIFSENMPMPIISETMPMPTQWVAHCAPSLPAPPPPCLAPPCYLAPPWYPAPLQIADRTSAAKTISTGGSGLPLTARWHCRAKTFAVKMVLSAKSLTICDKWVWLSTKSCEIRKGDKCWKYQQRICENLNFTQFKHPIVWSF